MELLKDPLPTPLQPCQSASEMLASMIAAQPLHALHSLELVIRCCDPRAQPSAGPHFLDFITLACGPSSDGGLLTPQLLDAAAADCPGGSLQRSLTSLLVSTQAPQVRALQHPAQAALPATSTKALAAGIGILRTIAHLHAKLPASTDSNNLTAVSLFSTVGFLLAQWTFSHSPQRITDAGARVPAAPRPQWAVHLELLLLADVVGRVRHDLPVWASAGLGGGAAGRLLDSLKQAAAATGSIAVQAPPTKGRSRKPGKAQSGSAAIKRVPLQLPALCMVLSCVFPSDAACNALQCESMGNVSEVLAAQKRCSKCKAAHYCSPSCQLAHWNSVGAHKYCCGPLAKHVA